MPLDLNTLSNEDIVSLCDSPDRHIISGSKGGRQVIRLSSTIVVKTGWSVTPEEAANQEHAHRCLCSSDVKAPKVYRYFQTSGVGYIVMENVQGVSLEKISLHSQPDLSRRLALAISTLATAAIPEFPGPRNGGVPRGYLFSEDGAGTKLNSIMDLN